MIALPNSAACRCLLADGRVLTVTATRRPRGNRADVKCVVAGAPGLAERMQDVVRLARHTEARFDSRDQVVLSMDGHAPAQERGWELAAVLADRLVRGEYRAAQPQLYAHGWSDAWHLGQVDGAPDLAAAALRRHLRGHGGTATAPALAAVIGGIGGIGAQGGERGESGVGREGSAGAPAQPDGFLYLSHLGALTGHTDPAASVSSARAWFPLHSGGINDTLGWVEVSVHPLAAPGAGHGGDEESTIAAPGLEMTAQLAVRQALAGARHHDGRGLGRWRTVVRFGQPRFQGASYELALVMADRLARGREFVPRGRLIASGCSAAWHAGRVDSVEGREPKIDLILRQAGKGDRVLLPKAWQALAPAGVAAQLQALGASLAWIDRIGIL